MELRDGKAVIVDATFYCAQMRDMFFTLASLMHLKPVFIEIIAEEKLIRKRLRKKAELGARGLSVYNLVKTQYEPLVMDHLIIESKDDNVEGML